MALSSRICYCYGYSSKSIKINLIGFDGYTADDPGQEEMNNVFSIYEALEESVPIQSLTPATYRINQSSIFPPHEFEFS